MATTLLRTAALDAGMDGALCGRGVKIVEYRDALYVSPVQYIADRATWQAAIRPLSEVLPVGTRLMSTGGESGVITGYGRHPSSRRPCMVLTVGEEVIHVAERRTIRVGIAGRYSDPGMDELFFGPDALITAMERSAA